MTTLDDAELRRRYRELLRDEAPVSHPTEDEWVRFADDTLDAGSRQRLADHLGVCAACGDIFRVVAEVRAGAAALSPDAIPRRGPGVRPVWYGLAAAAALAVAVSGAVWLGRDRGAPSSAPEAGSRSAQMPAVDPAPPAAPSMPGWALLVEPPAVRLPAALALTMRGAGNGRDGFMGDFGRAIAPYRQGRFAEAVPGLARVAAAHPDVDETWFYLGASQLFGGNPEAAIEPLVRARRSTEVGDEAQWLEAVALARAGRTDDATARLRVLCAASRPASARACAAERP